MFCIAGGGGGRFSIGEKGLYVVHDQKMYKSIWIILYLFQAQDSRYSIGSSKVLQLHWVNKVHWKLESQRCSRHFPTFWDQRHNCFKLGHLQQQCPRGRMNGRISEGAPQWSRDCLQVAHAKLDAHLVQTYIHLLYMLSKAAMRTMAQRYEGGVATLMTTDTQPQQWDG